MHTKEPWFNKLSKPMNIWFSLTRLSFSPEKYGPFHTWGYPFQWMVYMIWENVWENDGKWCFFYGKMMENDGLYGKMMENCLYRDLYGKMRLKWMRTIGVPLWRTGKPHFIPSSDPMVSHLVHTAKQQSKTRNLRNPPRGGVGMFHGFVAWVNFFRRNDGVIPWNRLEHFGGLYDNYDMENPATTIRGL